MSKKFATGVLGKGVPTTSLAPKNYIVVEFNNQHGVILNRHEVNSLSNNNFLFNPAVSDFSYGTGLIGTNCMACGSNSNTSMIAPYVNTGSYDGPAKFDPDSDWTISFWVKSSDPHSRGGMSDYNIFNIGFSNKYWALVSNTSDDSMSLWLVDPAGNTEKTTSISPWNGAWHLIVIRNDTGNGGVTLDLDAGTTTTSATDFSSADWSTGTTGTCKIEWGYAGFGGGSITADMDQISFWTRVLTDSEVSTLYNSGSGYAASNWGSTGCPTVSISESDCTGWSDTQGTLTANITGTCTNPTYQWYVATPNANGYVVDDIPSATSSTYTNTAKRVWMVKVTCGTEECYDIWSDPFVSTCGLRLNVAFLANDPKANTGQACALTSETFYNYYMEMAGSTPASGDTVYAGSSGGVGVALSNKAYKWYDPYNKTWYAAVFDNNGVMGTPVTC